MSCRLVVISNRVAVPKARGAAGAQGGLAGALNSALKKHGGIWFGWSGDEMDEFTGNIDLQRNDGVTTATIDLERAGHRRILQRLRQFDAVAAVPLPHRSDRI